MASISDELSRLFEEVDAMDFYREIFPEGELDEWSDDPEERTKGKYTAIAVEITKEKKKDGRPLVKRYSITDELDGIDALTYSKNFCVLAPISYAGKSRESTNARVMYALCIELDNLIASKNGRQRGLEALMNQWTERVDWIPRPTFLVASGSGVHLYYVFEEGIPLFKNVVDSLKLYKRELTWKIWNRHTTTDIGDKIQHESIFQAFRMVGTRTKKDDVVRAYRTGERLSIDYMNHFVDPKNQIVTVYKSKLSKGEARAKFPEWYERRIVNGQPRGRWTCDRAVYEWWYSKVLNGATVGHRYYCLMMLCIYAVKCDISREELEEDCFRLMKILDEKTDKPENRFTEKDVLDALQAFEDKSLVTYPVTSIQNRSGIDIPRNKRNHRKKAIHVKIMTSTRDILYPEGEWRNKDGRPKGSGTAHEKVQRWRQDNPEGTKKECKDSTGLTYPTIRKWWDVPLRREYGNFTELSKEEHDRFMFTLDK